MANNLADERARRLETAVAELLQQVDGLAPPLLYQEPGGDEWSLMKILAHVAEVLPYWARQAQAVAARERDNLPFGRTHDDPERIEAVERHARDPLEAVLPRLQSGLAEAVAVVRGLPQPGWDRTARHARRGEMSVAQIVDQFLIDHAEEHARQAAATLAAVASR